MANYFFYLNLNPIKGDVTAPNFKDWIAVDSFTLTMANPQAGRKLAEVSFAGRPGKHSTALQHAATIGRKQQSVLFAVVKADKPEDAERITFIDFTLTHYRAPTTRGDNEVYTANYYLMTGTGPKFVAATVRPKDRPLIELAKVMSMANPVG